MANKNKLLYRKVIQLQFETKFNLTFSRYRWLTANF